MKIKFRSIFKGKKLEWFPKVTAATLSGVTVIRRQSLESMFSNWYLNWCLYFATTSDRLFSMSFPVCSAIASFSVRHNAHLWAVGLYVLLFWSMHHYMTSMTTGVPPASLTFHTSFESSLSALSFGSLNVLLCSLNLSLKVLSVIPL